MERKEKRKHERFKPGTNVLVKEDNGSIINYYHVEDISLGGMYLRKKIASSEEMAASYTFLVPECDNPTISGKVMGTRVQDGAYGTAVQFNEEASRIVNYISKISDE